MLNNDERTVAHQSQDKLLKMRGNVGRLLLLLSFFFAAEHIFVDVPIC